MIEFANLASVEGVNYELATEIMNETGWKQALESMTKEEIAVRFLSRNLKVNAIAKSIHDEPRRKEGSTRDDRRKDFMDRNQKPWKKDSKFKPFFKGEGKFGDRKKGDFKKGDFKKADHSKGDRMPAGAVRGKSKKPMFSTFKDPKFQRAVIS